eukprot:gene11865-14009_t
MHAALGPAADAGGRGAGAERMLQLQRAASTSAKKKSKLGSILVSNPFKGNKGKVARQASQNREGRERARSTMEMAAEAAVLRDVLESETPTMSSWRQQTSHTRNSSDKDSRLSIIAEESFSVS